MEQLKPTLDELVFENRNKAYGAYLLRQIYHKHIGIAVAIVSTTVSLTLGGPFAYLKFYGSKDVVVKEKNVEVKLEEIEIPPLDPTSPPPPPPPPMEEVKIKTVKYVKPEVVPDNKITKVEEIPTVEDIDKAAIGNENKEGEEDQGLNPITEKGVPGGTGITEAPDDQIYMPAAGLTANFPGGEKALHDYMQKGLAKSIKKAERLGDKGRVMILFVVEKDGSITNVKIQKGLAICTSCNEDALEIVKNMPKWEPAKVNGSAKRSYFQIPITYDFPD